MEADLDEDGVPDACDICPGGDDYVDYDGDGIPNFCDTECYEESIVYVYDIPQGAKIIGVSFEHQGIEHIIRFDQDEHFYADIYCQDGSNDPCNYYYGNHAALASSIISYQNSHFDVSDQDLYAIEIEPATWLVSFISGAEGVKWILDTGDEIAANLKDVSTLGLCDDGDICSINDRWTSDCLCHGDLLDSDGDCIPDGCDQCPGLNDGLDLNHNGIPDCIDGHIPIDAPECDDPGICEYYIHLLELEDVIIPLREDDLAAVDFAPKMIQRNIYQVSQELKERYIDHGEAGCFGFPELLDQLEHLGDDNNGIPNFIDPFGDEPVDPENAFYTAEDLQSSGLCEDAIRAALLFHYTIEILDSKEEAGHPCSPDDPLSMAPVSGMWN